MNQSTVTQETSESPSKSVARGCGVGVFMGLADSVPGISGGTVALVLGIYQRWITAIGNIDRTFLRHVRDRKFAAAARHADLVFLIGLACGIGVGFIVGVLTVAKLLESDMARQYLYSAFIGMVVASLFIVGRMIAKCPPIDTAKNIILTAVAAGLAAAVTFATPSTWSDAPPYWFVFLAASIAICAMVLPGISGALLLLILGMYKHLIDVAKETIHLENLGANFITIALFAAGALLGLLTFSKALKRMLENHAAATLVALRGLMIGSIVALWPFQKLDEKSKEELGKTIYYRYMPEQFDWHWVGMIVTMLFAMGLVWTVDAIARGKAKQGKQTENADQTTKS